MRRTTLGLMVAAAAWLGLSGCQAPAKPTPVIAPELTPQPGTTPNAGATTTQDVPPRLLSARGLAVGGRHACALVEDGSVRCWGRGSGGWLGTDNAPEQTDVPLVVAGITDVRSMTADRSRTCVVHDNGTMSCWGEELLWEAAGVLHVGTSGTPRLFPGLTDAVAVTLGVVDSCALREGGSARCWGRFPSKVRAAAKGADDNSPFDIALPAGTRALALGGGHACALDSSRSLSCWGPNQQGQLGVGDTRERKKPTRVVDLHDVLEIGATNLTTCALTEGGKLWCWGGTRCPPIGDCSFPDTAVPRPQAVPVAAELRAISMDTGGSLALDTDGNAWTLHPEAILAGGPGPQRITGVSDLVEVSVGANACGRTRSNEVKCWTKNSTEVTPETIRFAALCWPTNLLPEYDPGSLAEHGLERVGKQYPGGVAIELLDRGAGQAGLVGGRQGAKLQRELLLE